MSAPVPFLDLGAAQRELGGALEAAVGRVVESGHYVLGPELEAFEREFAAYCGTAHCVGVNSGTDAIELALRAAGIGPGDEVIVPAYTWIATWTAVRETGARPVGVDVEAGTYNLDPALVEAALSERTAAIVPVHLRGQPADLDALAAIAARAGVFLLEDAAQAHGARHRGRRAGSVGGAGCFSFHPTKNLGAIGNGGAVTTDDGELAARLRLLRNFGMRDRYAIESEGVNSRLDEIQAAALRAKLPHLDRWNQTRAGLAAGYGEALGGREELALPDVPEWADPAWHLFVLGHPDRAGAAAALAERGIATLVHYPLLPFAAAPFREEWSAEEFRVAARLAAAALSLPLHPQLDPADRDRVAAAVLETLPA